MLVLALLITACVGLRGPRKTEKSSSVVDFLYPQQAEPLVAPGVPVLRLPLRVGLAFVPVGAGRNWADDFSEAQKSGLLQRVAEEFKANQFIASIDVIPTTYLRAGGGFDNLDRVKVLLGLDVVVLVAYDQVQFTDQNKLSLAYWTIVGAYVFHGNRNDTDTLLEAIVYDIPSRKLLFRAPGSNRLQATSTGIEVRENLRKDSAESFNRAANDLIANLKTELAAFRERVKQAPDQVRIEHRPGYTGGGALEAWFVGALALLGLARRRARGQT
jgi:rhombotail lipoprotein